LEAALWTRSRLVGAWHRHVQDDGGRSAFGRTYEHPSLWSLSPVCSVSTVPDQKCSFYTEWGECN